MAVPNKQNARKNNDFCDKHGFDENKGTELGFSVQD